VLWGPVALVAAFCNSCCSWCWNNLSISFHWTGGTWRTSRCNWSVALCRSSTHHSVEVCLALFSSTTNCLHFVEVTCSAQYTWAFLAAWFYSFFRSCNRWNYLGNYWSTVAFTDFNIVCAWNAPFHLKNCFSASSSAVRDKSEWLCWLTSREYSHNANTAPHSIARETLSTVVCHLSWSSPQVELNSLPVFYSCSRSVFPAGSCISMSHMV